MVSFIVQFIGIFFGVAALAIANKLWGTIYDVLVEKRFKAYLEFNASRLEKHLSFFSIIWISFKDLFRGRNNNG